MTWVKIDDAFYRHRKARAAGKDGRALFVASLCWCAANGTDGHIAAYDLAVLAAEADVKPAATARRLVDVGLWHPVDDGWVVHDYLDYNPTAAHVEAVKAKRADAGRRGGSKKRSNQQANSEANCLAQDEHTGSKTGTPYPVTPSESSTSVVSPPVPATDDDDRSIVIAIARARGHRLDPSRVYGWNWIRRTADSLEPHRARIIALRAEGLDPAAIDLALDGHTTTASTPAPTPGPVAPAPWTPTIVPDALEHDEHADAVRALRSALA